MRSDHRLLRATVALTAALTAVVALALPAMAGQPMSVDIVSDMTFPGDGPNVGTFDASGPAVDAGIICPHGTVEDTRYVVGGFQSGQKVQIQVRKTFTCTDAAGAPGDSFFIKIQVHASFDGTETFGWVVQGGTGGLAGLQGSGSGITVDPSPTGNTNIYEGFLVP